MDCSGHGTCQTLKGFAADSGVAYGAHDGSTWTTCRCDTGFHGFGCEKRTCPSGPDPLDGGEGAEVGRECSGRGACDEEQGTCECHPGFTGASCEIVSALF